MNWTAVVPLNVGRERKSRLAARLSTAERDRLADALASHVLRRLKSLPAISRLVVLSPERPAEADVEWRRDLGRGLNAELMALRDSEAGPLVVVLGDLPLLHAEDVCALLRAGETVGVALAPDRHRVGTNAIAALPAFAIAYAFGPDSLKRHLQSAPAAKIVERRGLALDVDTPADLEVAMEAGWSFEN